jgi:hypothetical protein
MPKSGRPSQLKFSVSIKLNKSHALLTDRGADIRGSDEGARVWRNSEIASGGWRYNELPQIYRPSRMHEYVPVLVAPPKSLPMATAKPPSSGLIALVAFDQTLFSMRS